MPYSITTDSDECDGFAVVKDSDGTVMGCHDTEEEAAAQVIAIAENMAQAERHGKITAWSAVMNKDTIRTILDAVAPDLSVEDLPDWRALDTEQASEDDRADGVDTTPTEAMQDAARRGLEMHDEGKGGDGLEGATVREAQRMADGEALTEAKVRKGNAFWGRNDSYCNDDASDAQVTSRLLWGGCGSIDWFQRKYEAFEGMDSDRAAIEDLSEGTRVTWEASGGMAYGAIDTVETDGSISADPDGPTMEGTDEDPAYGIVVYDRQEDDDGEMEWMATDVMVVHRAETLTVIEDFPEERSSVATGGRSVQRSYVESPSVRMASDGKRTTVQVMTEDLARDGMVIEADGLDTEAYMRNPVVLWQHGQDPRRGYQPIARCVDLQRVDGGMRGTLEWYDDDFSVQIRDQVKRGYLSAVSLGFINGPIEQREMDDQRVPVVTESEMTEFSFVGVPADAGALVTQRDVPTERDIEAIMERVLDKRIEALTTAATAATSRAISDSSATADGSADALHDASTDGRESTIHTVDDLERMLDRILQRKLGKA